MRPFFCVFAIVLCLGFSSLAFAEGNSAQLLLWNVPKTGKAAFLPDLSLIGSFAGAYFRDDPGGDQAENPSVTGFNFQGVELGIQSVVDSYVRGDVFILFVEDAVEVEEATVTTLSLPWNFQMKAGKLLAQFGRENARHLDQLSFVDASQTNRYFFGNEGFKELGVETSLLLPLPWYSQVLGQFLQGDNPGNFDGGGKGDFAYLGRLINTVDLSKDVTVQGGFSAAFGRNNAAANADTQIYGGDFYLRYRPSTRRGLKWQTEYFFRHRQGATGYREDGGLDSQLIFQFARRFETGLRFDWIGIPDDGYKERAIAGDLTFLATEFFKLRGQYNYIAADGFRNSHEAFLQLQFNMGPHGAHQF